MNIPEELKYTEEHEWVRIEDNIAVVGITAVSYTHLRAPRDMRRSRMPSSA